MEIAKYKELKAKIPSFGLKPIGGGIYACAITKYDETTGLPTEQPELFQVTMKQLQDLRATWQNNLDALDEMIKDVESATQK